MPAALVVNTGVTAGYNVIQTVSTTYFPHIANLVLLLHFFYNARNLYRQKQPIEPRSFIMEKLGIVEQVSSVVLYSGCTWFK